MALQDGANNTAMTINSSTPTTSPYTWVPSSYGALDYVYMTVPANPTSCLVNIVYSGTPPKPTSVLANPGGGFLLGQQGQLIPAESPFCLPYTDENVQTITVANNWPAQHRSTQTITVDPYSSAGGYYRNVSGYSSWSSVAMYSSAPAMNAGEIAGIVLGCVAALGILSAIAILCWWRKRSKRVRVELTPSEKDDGSFESSLPYDRSSKYATTLAESDTSANDNPRESYQFEKPRNWLRLSKKTETA